MSVVANIDSNEAVTTNGMDTLASSLNACVDLFFQIGASRGKDITQTFAKALVENTDIALRIAAYTRDARGGAGERQTFRNMLSFLEGNHPEFASAIIPKIAELGRFDDLLVFKSTNLRQEAFAQIKSALDAGNGLAAKWMPRKGYEAVQLREYLGLTPKAYRKLLVGLTNVVESKMCAKDWNNINFEHVPSVASSRYMKAFRRNATEAYTAYLEAVVRGEKTIKAGAVMPYDIVRACRHGDGQGADVQWKALPNYMGDARVLPLVDVSGSMDISVSGSVTAMDVAISVGIYIAEKQEGAFKNLWCTFSTNPKLESLRGNTLSDIVHNMEHSDWGGSTNVEAAFTEILRVATKHNVPANEMPEYLMIMSDMNFDMATGRYRSLKATAYNVLAEKFADAGYQLPKIVFWNIKGGSGNVPVTYDTNGTALVSGFSPSILKSIFNCKEFTPQHVMLEAVMKDRYKVI
jgi:uncharacterized protein YejL (UPF0352 family)